MVTANWITEKQFRFISFLLFALLFGYLFLRALFVDYLHDDAATFLHYIETGYFFGPKSITDANNHILNSIIGHGLYKLFGENRFLFRLPNLLSFPVYFWAIWQLIRYYSSPLNRLFVLLGLTCIPFILEYFANCRGYGISIAFFMASLAFLQRSMHQLTLKQHALIALCIVIACYANLTYLVTAVLATVFILIQQLRQKANLSLRQQVLHSVFHGVLVLSLIPAGMYARELKLGGALYYGGLDGLWDVTGTSLSRYTLFTDHIALKWIFLTVGLFFIGLLVFRWITRKFHLFFLDTSTLFAWFLFGHLFVIVVLATFMEVNYPEDRVGMYLIPLSLLFLSSELNRVKSLNFLFVSYLFFPIAMVPKINVETSVFSPDDRMTSTFYQNVEKEITNDHTSLSVYHLMRLTWSLHNRNARRLLFPTNSTEINQASDLVLSRENLKIPPEDLSNYDTVFLDESNGFVAFKRKLPYAKKLIFDTLINTPTSNAEYFGVRTFVIPDTLKNQKLQMHIKGKIRLTNPRDEVSLVYAVFNPTGEQIYAENWVTRWSNGLKKNHAVLMNIPVEKWTKLDYEVRIYFFNRLKTSVALENVKFELLRLE